jgi:hypothetical protein
VSLYPSLLGSVVCGCRGQWRCVQGQQRRHLAPTAAAGRGRGRGHSSWRRECSRPRNRPPPQQAGRRAGLTDFGEGQRPGRGDPLVIADQLSAGHELGPTTPGIVPGSPGPGSRCRTPARYRTPQARRVPACRSAARSAPRTRRSRAPWPGGIRRPHCCGREIRSIRDRVPRLGHSCLRRHERPVTWVFPQLSGVTLEHRPRPFHGVGITIRKVTEALH